LFPIRAFRHCPACGKARADVGANPLKCGCGFTYFFNPTVAAGAFLFDPAGRALFIRRSNEPAKGLLAVPGGFIDLGETLEAGLRRELREEVGLVVTELRFVCSEENAYPYEGVTYPVVDCLFAGKVTDPKAAKPLDGVARIEWHELSAVRDDELAFPSIRTGRRKLRDVHTT
jgi:ADP-ribose pyrophosphatase YjhB (NUDIX family)